MSCFQWIALLLLKKKLEIYKCLKYKLKKIQDAVQHVRGDPICETDPYVVLYFLRIISTCYLCNLETVMPSDGSENLEAPSKHLLPINQLAS